MTSIRRRLIGWLLGALTLLWLLTAAAFLLDVRGELDQVLDSRLAASARMVQGLISRGELNLPAGGDITRETPLAASLPTEMSCQLWSLDGALLNASGDTPRINVNSLSDGFGNHEVNGIDWRAYVLTDQASGVRIVTSERVALRESLMRDMAGSILVPLALTLPLIGAIVWLGVGGGLRPLQDVRRALARRSVESLHPLPVTDIPVEIAPLVTTLNDLLERLDNSIERERRFTADAAHELRTPLAAIKTQMQVALISEGEAQHRALRHAEQSLDRMVRLVNQMLELSRLDESLFAAGDAPECDPWPVLRDVAQELAPLSEKRGIRLVLNDEGGECQAAISSSLLRVALRNLVDNAIRHTPDGGRVELHLACRTDQVELRVNDDGPGIPAPELDRVTQRFHRATRVGPGTGLGLSIVAGIMRRHRGQLRLENVQQGRGLVATLILPRCDASEDT